MPSVVFKLSTKKWVALAEILITVVMQSLQYIWYLLIIDALPNLGRLFSNRFIFVASNLIQVVIMGLFSLGALSKHWPLWFITAVSCILFIIAVAAVIVDASYSAISAVEVYVTQTVFWPGFNQTIAITHEESVYQTVSIVFFALQALVYDIAQIAVIAWVYKEPLKCKVCFWTKGAVDDEDGGQNRFHEIADEEELNDKRIIAEVATAPQDRVMIVLDKYAKTD